MDRQIVVPLQRAWIAVNGSLRIVSANLWNGSAEPEAFARLLAELHPDVVAVQELAPEQADAIARVMPHGVLHPKNNCMGMGLALRRVGTVRRVSLPVRDALVTEIRSQDAAPAEPPVEIVNVHVQAPHSSVLRTLNRRRGQIQGILRHLDQGVVSRRLAVVGDFNATPIWPLYRLLDGRLTDAARTIADRRGTRPLPTWGPWSGARRLLRIDHAFVGGLAVQDFRVLPLAGSDHSAIVVDLSLD